jgi:uncharacterized membrane protein
MAVFNKSTRSLIVGGLFFSIPLIMVLILWKHFAGVIRPIAEKISDLFQLRSIFGPASILIVCIIFFLILCYLGGLLIEKGIIKKWSAKFEKKLFVFFPSLQIVKFRLMDDDQNAINEFWPAIIFKEDIYYKIGFITEQKDVFTAVYIPDAPKLDAGEVRYMVNKNFEYYPITMKQAMSAIYDFGEGLDIASIIQQAVDNENAIN